MNLKNKKITAAIFDMDGTMFDTERLRMKMIQKASSHLTHKELPDSYMIDCLGLSASSAKQLAFDLFGETYPYEEVRRLADKFEYDYIQEHGVPVKYGLYDVLERFKRNNIFLAVATSSKREIAQAYLMQADVYKYFDVIICGDEVTHGKPHPEIFQHAIQKINCMPEECVIFEDSYNGLKAAIASHANPIFLKDIKDMPHEILDQVFLSYDSMDSFLVTLQQSTKNLSIPKINETFPFSKNEKVVGIHGFGAIGGGYIAQIFSHWDGYTKPYKIIGATRNQKTITLVNTFHSYKVFYEQLAFSQEINDIELISMSDDEKMKDMYLTSSMIALCLTEEAIKQQALFIASYLKERYEKKLPPLTLLIIMNKVNAKEFLFKQLAKHLSLEEANDIFSYHYYCETVVNRMVTKIKLKTIEHNLKFNFEQAKIPVKGNVYTYLKNLKDTNLDISDLCSTLFISETDMPLYVSNESPQLSYLRQVKTYSDLAALQVIKNRLSNGTHALIAWYSKILGYDTIGQGMGDMKVLNLAAQVMEKELKPALIKQYPQSEDYMNDFAEAFFARCRHSFKDPCNRVGRDPIRKLLASERILGSIKLVKKCGIDPTYLSYGAALGFYYAIFQLDSEDKESQILKDLYEECHHSIYKVLCFHGDFQGKHIHFFDTKTQQKELELTASFFEQLSVKDYASFA